MLCACGCDKEVSGGRRYYRGHCPPEVTAERKRANAARRQAAYRVRYPDRVKASWKAWYDADPVARGAERVKAYRESLDPEVLRAQQKRNNQRRDPAKVRANVRLRKQRMRGAPLTPEAREYVPILLADPCSYCGEPGGTVDHIVPVVAGGDSDWPNLTAACQPCNATKRESSLLAFL